MSEIPKVRCPKCGAWVPATYLVCPYCGANLTEKKTRLIAEARSLRERLISLYKAIRTLNFLYALELLLVPVPGFYLLYVTLYAYLLARPMIGISLDRPLAFSIVFFFRFLLILLITDIYVKIITARKIRNHDIRTETIGLGSLWLFLIGLFYIPLGVTSPYIIFATIATVFSLAAVYRVIRLRVEIQYAIIPIIVLAVSLAFIAIRFLLPWI